MLISSNRVRDRHLPSELDQLIPESGCRNCSIKAKLEGEKESKDVVAQLKDEIHELKAEIKRLAPNQVKPFKVAEFDNWTTLMKWRFALLTHTVLQLKGLTKQVTTTRAYMGGALENSLCTDNISPPLILFSVEGQGF